MSKIDFSLSYPHSETCQNDFYIVFLFSYPNYLNQVFNISVMLIDLQHKCLMKIKQFLIIQKIMSLFKNDFVFVLVYEKVLFTMRSFPKN